MNEVLYLLTSNEEGQWSNPFKRRINRERFKHWWTKGKVGRHVLSGGWCPLCHAVYYYERGGWRDVENQETDSSGEATVMVNGR